MDEREHITGEYRGVPYVISYQVIDHTKHATVLVPLPPDTSPEDPEHLVGRAKVDSRVRTRYAVLASAHEAAKQIIDSWHGTTAMLHDAARALMPAERVEDV